MSDNFCAHCSFALFGIILLMSFEILKQIHNFETDSIRFSDFPREIVLFSLFGLFCIENRLKKSKFFDLSHLFIQ